MDTRQSPLAGERQSLSGEGGAPDGAIDCLAQESADNEMGDCLIPLREVLADIEIGGIRLGDFAEVIKTTPGPTPVDERRGNA
jgi:hypothetical protein